MSLLLTTSSLCTIACDTSVLKQLHTTRKRTVSVYTIRPRHSWINIHACTPTIHASQNIAGVDDDVLKQRLHCMPCVALCRVTWYCGKAQAAACKSKKPVGLCMWSKLHMASEITYKSYYVLRGRIQA